MPPRPLPDTDLYVIAHPAGDGSFECQVVDGAGAVLLRVGGYRGVGLDSPVPADLQRPIRAAMSA